jgi:hypothetical protein
MLTNSQDQDVQRGQAPLEPVRAALSGKLCTFTTKHSETRRAEIMLRFGRRTQRLNEHAYREP